MPVNTCVSMGRGKSVNELELVKPACLKSKWLSLSIKAEADELVAQVLRRPTPKKSQSSSKGELGIPLCASKHFDNRDQQEVNDVKLDL